MAGRKSNLDEKWSGSLLIDMVVSELCASQGSFFAF